MPADRQRILRHLAFWATRILFVSLAVGLFNYTTKLTFLQNISIGLRIKSGLIILVEVPFCYLMTYLFAPRYLMKKKYGLFLLSFSGCFLVGLAESTFYLYWLQEWRKYSSDDLFWATWANATGFIVMGPPGVWLIFYSLKTLRNWRAEQKKTQILLKATTEAEIGLLEAQVHPHFLFNTLNNIYTFAREGSPIALQMIRQLSDMLRFIVDHCSDAQVSLDKELTILENYIELERVRYGNHLKIDVAITGRPTLKTIAPQLMLPLLENSFKHGTSQTLDAPWIKLSIRADGDLLHFTLSNGKPLEEGYRLPLKGGIGLANVQKRLSLMYPSDYYLQVTNDATVFTVDMRVPLHPLIPTGDFLPGLSAMPGIPEIQRSAR